MPFKSVAQRGYLWANHPEVAREFAHATPAGAKLPRHVKGQKRAAGGALDEAMKQTKTACLEALENALQTSRSPNLMNQKPGAGSSVGGNTGPQLKSSACQNRPPSVISDNLGQPANSKRPEPAISFPGQNATMAKMAAMVNPAPAEQ